MESALTLNKILGIAKDFFLFSHLSAIHCDHVMEQVEKSSYKKLLCEHVNGKTKNCGLFVELWNICFGALPDSLAPCSCWWDGVVEIKCPYTCKDVSPLIIPLLFLEVVNVAMKQ